MMEYIYIIIYRDTGDPLWSSTVFVRSDYPRLNDEEFRKMIMECYDRLETLSEFIKVFYSTEEDLY